MKEESMDGAPGGSVPFTHENSLMNEEVFLKWLKYIAKHAKPIVENKILLFLNGHTVIMNLEAMTYSNNNCIILNCFPRIECNRLMFVSLDH